MMSKGLFLVALLLGSMCVQLASCQSFDTTIESRNEAAHNHAVPVNEPPQFPDIRAFIYACSACAIKSMPGFASFIREHAHNYANIAVVPSTGNPRIEFVKDGATEQTLHLGPTSTLSFIIDALESRGVVRRKSLKFAS